MKKQNIKVLGISFSVEAYNLHKFTKSEALVYSLIQSYWRAKAPFYMATKNIAIVLNLCERTVIYAIKELEKRRLIVCERTANKRIIRQPVANEAHGNLKDLFNSVFDKITN